MPPPRRHGIRYLCRPEGWQHGYGERQVSHHQRSLGYGRRYGLFAQSSVTPDYKGDVSTININAEDTVINVTSGAGESHQYGIIAMSNSRVNVNGNLTVNAGNGDAILTRGGSVITINPNKDKTVQLTGNIEYNYNVANSGNIADSTVNLNLSDANSFWTGNTVLSNGGASDSSSDTVAGLNLNLSNGGTWNVPIRQLPRLPNPALPRLRSRSIICRSMTVP